MGLSAWIGIAIAVILVVFAIIAHQSYRREVARAKKSRWATWRDQPRKFSQPGELHGGFTITRDDGYD